MSNPRYKDADLNELDTLIQRAGADHRTREERLKHLESQVEELRGRVAQLEKEKVVVVSIRQEPWKPNGDPKERFAEMKAWVEGSNGFMRRMMASGRQSESSTPPKEGQGGS